MRTTLLISAVAVGLALAAPAHAQQGVVRKNEASVQQPVTKKHHRKHHRHHANAAHKTMTTTPNKAPAKTPY